MRWVTFIDPESKSEAVGVVDGMEIVRVPNVPSLLDLLQAGTKEMAEQGKHALTSRSMIYDLDGVRLAAPVPRPPSIRDFMAFEQHLAVAARRRSMQIPDRWYDVPVFYFSNPHAIYGPSDDVPIPPGCEKFDFEVEVAVVIGLAGSNLAPEQAEGHISGYTIMNDWSARDLAWKEYEVPGPGPSKAKDSATTLGPMLVTPDELGDRSGLHFDLGMTVSVNGRRYGGDRLTNMYWSFAELVAHASRGTWVRPGDIIASGTCGEGCLVELVAEGKSGPITESERFPWLRTGDEVTIEVTGLGKITNRIVPGPPVVPLRGTADAYRSTP